MLARFGTRAHRRGVAAPLQCSVVTPAGHRDYLGTPLPAKLGVREGSRVLVIAAPQGFALEPLPSGVELLSRARRPIDVVLLFTTREADLRRRFPTLVRALDPTGRLWVAWPKKASGLASDLSFSSVQGVGLSAGLVDNKSGSIDERFQGLQFVVRLRDRPARTS
jgi:hypothetical protein